MILRDNSTASGKLVLDIEDSYFDAIHPTGDTGNSAVRITGHDIDFDVTNSTYKTYSRSGAWQNSAFSSRIDGYDDIQVNFESSNLIFYGYHRGMQVNYHGFIHKDDPNAEAIFRSKVTGGLNNCIIVNAAKADMGYFTFCDYNEGSTTEDSTLSPISNEMITNSIALQYNNIDNTAASYEATVYGSPVISQDFQLPNSLGSISDMAAVTPNLTLAAGQTLTIKEGATLTMPEGVNLVLSPGASLKGNYVGKVILQCGAVFHDGDQLFEVAVPQGSQLTANQIPADPAASQGCEKLSGWYTHSPAEIVNPSQVVFNSVVHFYPAFEDDHAWGKWTYLNETHHVQVCAKDSSHTQQQAHQGGTATASSQAICQVCQAPYGAIMPTPVIPPDTGDHQPLLLWLLLLCAPGGACAWLLARKKARRS